MSRQTYNYKNRAKPCFENSYYFLHFYFEKPVLLYGNQVHTYTGYQVLAPMDNAQNLLIDSIDRFIKTQCQKHQGNLHTIDLHKTEKGMRFKLDDKQMKIATLLWDENYKLLRLTQTYNSYKYADYIKWIEDYFRQVDGVRATYLNERWIDTREAKMCDAFLSLIKYLTHSDPDIRAYTIECLQNFYTLRGITYARENDWLLIRQELAKNAFWGIQTPKRREQQAALLYAGYPLEELVIAKIKEYETNLRNSESSAGADGYSK